MEELTDPHRTADPGGESCEESLAGSHLGSTVAAGDAPGPSCSRVWVENTLHPLLYATPRSQAACNRDGSRSMPKVSVLHCSCREALTHSLMLCETASMLKNAFLPLPAAPGGERGTAKGSSEPALLYPRWDPGPGSICCPAQQVCWARGDAAKGAVVPRRVVAQAGHRGTQEGVGAEKRGSEQWRSACSADFLAF